MYQWRIYVILLFFPVLGIYNIVNGILYYVFAEEKTAVVVKKRIKAAKKYNSLYRISVNIEDLGETITVPMETEFRLNHKDIGVDDKITVWYLKNSTDVFMTEVSR